MTEFLKPKFSSKASTDAFRKGHDRIWKKCALCESKGWWDDGGMKVFCSCDRGRDAMRLELNDDR